MLRKINIQAASRREALKIERALLEPEIRRLLLLDEAMRAQALRCVVDCLAAQQGLAVLDVSRLDTR